MPEAVYETLLPGRPRFGLISRYEQKEKDRPSMPAHFPTFPQVLLLRIFYLNVYPLNAHGSRSVSLFRLHTMLGRW